MRTLEITYERKYLRLIDEIQNKGLTGDKFILYVTRRGATLSEGIEHVFLPCLLEERSKIN